MDSRALKFLSLRAGALKRVYVYPGSEHENVAHSLPTPKAADVAGRSVGLLTEKPILLSDRKHKDKGLC